MAMQYDVWSVKIRSSTNFYVTSVTPSGAGALTLANTTPGINGYGYKVTVRAASTNESGVNFTITGTTVGGVVVTEVIAGPDGSGGAATTSTTNYFASVSSITTSAGTTGAITVGYSGNLALPMTRIKGLYYLAGASAGTIIVTRASDSTLLLEIDTPGADTQVNSLYMAAEGIRTTYKTNDLATVAVTNVTAVTLICG